MKTDRFTSLRAGDVYDRAELELAVVHDVQTIKSILGILLDNICAPTTFDNAMLIRRALKEKLEIQ